MSFLDAPAPMTAKCIMRDHVMKAAGCNAAEAEKVAASIVGEMLSWGFEVQDVYPRNEARQKPST
jgi:hypothetical protein